MMWKDNKKCSHGLWQTIEYMGILRIQRSNIMNPQINWDKMYWCHCEIMTSPQGKNLTDSYYLNLSGNFTFLNLGLKSHSEPVCPKGDSGFLSKLLDFKLKLTTSQVEPHTGPSKLPSSTSLTSCILIGNMTLEYSLPPLIVDYTLWMCHCFILIFI